MEHKHMNITSGILSTAQIAIMAAIIYVATAVVNFPSPYHGVVHAGDSMVLLAAVLFGKKKGFIASAIGMSLFDLLSPYSIWAPFTFVIKGVMAYIAASIVYRKDYNGDNIGNNIFGFLLGGIWMIAGYYAAGVFINHLFFDKISWNASLIYTAADIPSNMLQVAVGIIIAEPISKLLKKAKVDKFIVK